MITTTEARLLAKGLTKEAEAVIDKALRSACESNKWPCTLSTRVTHVGDVAEFVILTKYRAAGWKVEVVSDHRDGSFYQFEAP